MKRSKACAGLVVVGLAAAVAAGCASESKKMAAMPGSGDVVADRQRLMKLHGDIWRDIQARAKANDLAGVATGAETFAINAQYIPALFPEGTLTEKSKAKPEVWQKWPEFEAAAKRMETESIKLRDAAKAKNEQATQAILKDFGRNACGSCHTPFRVPPPRS